MRGATTEKPRSRSVSLVLRVTRSMLQAERFGARPGTDAIFNQVLEVGGCSFIDGLMDNQADLELNHLLNWQPMERSEC